jgi:hypothetical protein
MDHGQDEAAAGAYSIYEDHPEDKKADPEPQKQPDKDKPQ